VFCEAQRHADRVALALRGDWRLATLSEIQAELAAVSLQGAGRLLIDAGSARLDLSGAWVLRDFLAQAAAAGVSADFSAPVPAALALIERTQQSSVAAEEAPGGPLLPWLDPALAVEGLGRRTVRSWSLVRSLLGFIGRVATVFGRTVPHLQRWRPASIARHVYDTGITAIPIVALIAFLIAVILAYMGAQQLRKFGADIFVVDLVTVGVLRELGVLLTAIIVAGRSGSAYAAEIGSMRLNEEVDALQAIGVNPIEVLVLPRVLGLVIALPLLTVIADAIGMVGGGLLCKTLLGMPLVQYINRANSALAPTTFWVGVIKAPVFAVLIALAGTWCGLRVRGSSRDLGRLTTLAVVQAIFFVILADALFAVLFMEMDI
jgi:phospholipid/cholesterol/gamma-HCH transport system permease protein